ncbi:hypothetical protein C2G38_2027987 [Gigaspora rosea]|uniref:Galactose oxidase n=1 Tax=Gigaspora rosea TaxID=44941 RepID=A0A397W704_9GLOM|nr:hypothetical protein C2G38_2027987 [Gigaspora rosea]
MQLFNFYIYTLFLNFTLIFAAFIPNGRFFHSSVLIDNKLYFSGGFKQINYSYITVTNEFFYLDVSKPFTTTDNDSIPWVDLTYTGGPLKAGTTACIGGKNNDMIFIFGGIRTNQPFVNQFDTNKQQWINITSVGNVPTNRYEISCANFDNGLIAIFSGFFNTTYSINDLWIFNTLTLTWSFSNATNAPFPMSGYCAVTLPDGNILYIGGHSFNLSNFIPMNNLPLYNTTSNTWTSKIILGPLPSPRNYFSAVLSVSNISDSSKIFMLDISRKYSYKWATEFAANRTNITTTTTTNSPTTNFLAGVIVGSIFSFIMFASAIFNFLVKRLNLVILFS